MGMVKFIGKALGLSTVLTVGAIGGIYATAIAYTTRTDELIEALDYFKGKYIEKMKVNSEKIKEYEPKIQEAKDRAKQLTDKLVEGLSKTVNPSIDQLLEELQKQADTLSSLGNYRFTQEDDKAVYSDCDGKSDCDCDKES